MATLLASPVKAAALNGKKRNVEEPRFDKREVVHGRIRFALPDSNFRVSELPSPGGLRVTFAGGGDALLLPPDTSKAYAWVAAARMDPRYIEIPSCCEAARDRIRARAAGNPRGWLIDILSSEAAPRDCDELILAWLKATAKENSGGWSIIERSGYTACVHFGSALSGDNGRLEVVRHDGAVMEVLVHVVDSTARDDILATLAHSISWDQDGR
jgi:hypothetical protein